MKLFNILLGVHGVLVRLSGKFASSQMIPFPVGGCGGGVGMGGKVVEFCGSIVITLWHGVLLPG